MAVNSRAGSLFSISHDRLSSGFKSLDRVLCSFILNLAELGLGDFSSIIIGNSLLQICPMQYLTGKHDISEVRMRERAQAGRGRDPTISVGMGIVLVELGLRRVFTQEHRYL